jgi:hypothetical protein
MQPRNHLLRRRKVCVREECTANPWDSSNVLLIEKLRNNNNYNNKQSSVGDKA